MKEFQNKKEELHGLGALEEEFEGMKIEKIKMEEQIDSLKIED